MLSVLRTVEESFQYLPPLFHRAGWAFKTDIEKGDEETNRSFVD